MNLWLLGGTEKGMGLVREFGAGCVHTAIFKMENQQGPTVYYTKLCSMLCGSLDGRGARGRMDSLICMSESLHCSPEIITTL